MEATNVDFVGEVEKYPELYDFNNPSYLRKDVVEKAWVAVGRKFNLSGPDSKEKWRNLRNSFVKNLKALASGSKRRKSYYLSDAMQFALPFVKAQGVISENVAEVPSPSSPTIIHPPPPENQHSEETPSEEFQSDEGETPSSPPPESLPSHRTPSPRSLFSSTERFQVELRPAKRKRVSPTADTSNAAHFAAENGPVRESDALKMFLLSLMPDLQSLAPSQLRTFKRRTMETIEELLDEGAQVKMSSSRNFIKLAFSHSEHQIKSE